MKNNSILRDIDAERLKRLKEFSRTARANILRMTKVANSGHPGGSMSSIDIFLVLFGFARISPEEPNNPDRDRIVVSHGHTSPAVYTTLAYYGFHDMDEVISTFRLAGSKFEGHIERHLSGIDWTTGNLGQGLSAGCGFALASKVLGKDFEVFVAMGDAEQAKGQVAEARRFAKKYGLSNLTVVIDYNRLQISGRTDKVMPVNIKENYLSDGWQVLEVDGHNYRQLLSSFRKAVQSGNPVCILARTVMGKNVSFMEDEPEYHGRPLDDREFERAMDELGFDSDLSIWKEMRKNYTGREFRTSHPPQTSIIVDVSKPRTYGSDKKIDNRSAFGNAAFDIAEKNINEGKVPVVAFDCDLASSVRLSDFSEKFPEYFFESGVTEHNTATTAGALSSQGVVTFFADFGVFGIDEVYNQQRLNDMNATNLKVIVTHCGIDVGEDGRTHHCIDYVGAVRNLYGFKLIVPADANQTDRAIRYVVSTHGNFVVAMGRSKIPIITDEKDSVLFGQNYEFGYGKVDKIREGTDAAILCMGSAVHRAVRIHQILKEEGIKAKVLNISCPLDIPEKTVKEAAGTGLILTYEDHNVESGLGAEVSKIIADNRIQTTLIRKGLRFYAPSGSAEDLYKVEGLDPETIAKEIIEKVRLRHEK